MKRALILSLGVIAVAAVAFTDPINPMAGRWQQRFSSGAMMLVNFRPDGTYDAFVNKKAFVSGKYHVRQDTVSISDESCNPDYYGTYKLHFFAQDSVRWNVIQDTCGGRRSGTDKGTLGRVKAEKP